jgi:hypothetical protein
MSTHAQRLLQIYSELASELSCDPGDPVVRQAAPLMLASEFLTAKLASGDLAIMEHLAVSKELASITDQLVALQALRPRPTTLQVVYADGWICDECKKMNVVPHTPQPPSAPKQLPKPELPSGDMLRPKEFTR